MYLKDYEITDELLDFQSMQENKDYQEQANLRGNEWPKPYDIAIDLQIKEYTRSSPIYNAK